MAPKIDIQRVAASALEAALHEEPAPRRRLRRPGTLATGAALVVAARYGKEHLPRLTAMKLVGRGLGKLSDIPNLGDVREAMRDKFADTFHQNDQADETEDYEDEDYEDEDFEDEDDDDQEYEGGEDDDEGDEDDDEDDEDDDDERGDDDGRDPRAGQDSEADEDEDEQDGDEEEDEQDERPREDDDQGQSGEDGGDDVSPAALLKIDSARASARDTPDLVGALSLPRTRPPVMERLAERGADPASRPPQAAERSSHGQRSSRSSRGTRSGSKRNTKSKNARR